MQYRISQEAVSRARKRWGNDAAKMLEKKIYFVNDWVDPLTAQLGVSPSDLQIVFDHVGWNPYPEIMPPVNAEKIYIVTDEKHTLFIAQWIKGKWAFKDYTGEPPHIIAFQNAPAKYKADQPATKHADYTPGRTKYGI